MRKMNLHLYAHLIILMSIFSMASGLVPNSVYNLYTRIQPGENIKGILVEENVLDSFDECSVR